MGDAVARAAAGDLQLGLAGSPPADATGEAGEGVVLLAEAREHVLELGELDLELAVAGLGALREDVEDELRAVDDLEVGDRRDGRHLRGREVAVEDEHVGVALEGAEHHLVELALAEHEARVDLIAHLGDLVDDDHTRGAGELAEFTQGVFDEVGLALVGDVNEHRAAVVLHGLARAGDAGELLLDGANHREEVGVHHVVQGGGALLAPDLVGGVFREEVRPEDVADGAVGLRVDGRDEVEAQAREVDEVVVGQRLAAQVRVYESQPAKPPIRRAEAAHVREHELVRIADDDVLDRAAAMHQHAHLPPGGGGGFGEGLREFGREDAVRGDAPTVDALERALVTGGEARGVAVDLDD